MPRPSHIQVLVLHGNLWATGRCQKAKRPLGLELRPRDFVCAASAAAASAAADALVKAAMRALNSMTVVAVKIFCPAALRRPFKSLERACDRSGTLVTPITASFCMAARRSDSDHPGRACCSTCQSSASGDDLLSGASLCEGGSSSAAAAKRVGFIHKSSMAMDKQKLLMRTACSMKVKLLRSDLQAYFSARQLLLTAAMIKSGSARKSTLAPIKASPSTRTARNMNPKSLDRLSSA
mmetsp:Transcript_43218/g.68431  ORF Transcript_43218/g.68431 Transcript_43218/m.68431 type:complete len:237 (-) Transcript_43218:966-1676(-)